MTNREFYNSIINGTITEEIVAFAESEIAKLDARNDKRRNTLSKTQEANEALKVEILSAIANGTHIASEIGKVVGVSTQKASALLTLLVKDGKVTVADLKVKGKGSVKTYSLAE